MQNLNYLYGSLSLPKTIYYHEALLIKILAAKKLQHKLVMEDNMEDVTRINKVAKAIDFNRELLKEIDYSDTDIRNSLYDYYSKLHEYLK